jgi:hypothetical protein
MDSPAPRLARLAAPPAASPGTPIRTTAGSITSAWRASPENTDVPLAPSSRSATPTAAAPARIPKTFPAGKSPTHHLATLARLPNANVNAEECN